MRLTKCRRCSNLRSFRPGLHPQLDGESQDFRDTPCLGRTPAGAVGFIGLEDFADLADAGGALQVVDQWLEPAPRLLDRLGRALVDPQVRLKETADGPGPDRAVVVRLVALALGA